jgi:hypothetical protein
MLSDNNSGQRPSSSWEAQQEAAAARAAAAIGGRAGDENLDPAQRPLIEAGEGVAEGFELAEEELIEAASHGSSTVDPLHDQFPPEAEPPRAAYGEPDHEESTEVRDSDY